MYSDMIALGLKQIKILRGVVSFVAVKVVANLSISKRASQLALQYQDVFIHIAVWMRPGVFRHVDTAVAICHAYAAPPIPRRISCVAGCVAFGASLSRWLDSVRFEYFRDSAAGFCRHGVPLHSLAAGMALLRRQAAPSVLMARDEPDWHSLYVAPLVAIGPSKRSWLTASAFTQLFRHSISPYPVSLIVQGWRRFVK